jgi:hypothetical protein
MSQFDNLVSIAPVTDFRWENPAPVMYRLARTADGELLLQGLYQWGDNRGTVGSEWRTVETVQLPAIEESGSATP